MLSGYKQHQRRRVAHLDSARGPEWFAGGDLWGLLWFPAHMPGIGSPWQKTAICSLVMSVLLAFHPEYCTPVQYWSAKMRYQQRSLHPKHVLTRGKPSLLQNHLQQWARAIKRYFSKETYLFEKKATWADSRISMHAVSSLPCVSVSSSGCSLTDSDIILKAWGGNAIAACSLACIRRKKTSFAWAKFHIRYSYLAWYHARQCFTEHLDPEPCRHFCF